MSLADWHQQEERRLTYEWIATQRAAAEHCARRQRRRRRGRICLHWLDPTKQIVSDVGRLR